MSDELRETFFLECQELLEALEAGLLDLSNGEADDVDETIAAVFRAVHSVKGGAGAFALDKLVRLAHKFETALDGAREKRLEAFVATLPEVDADQINGLGICASAGYMVDAVSGNPLVQRLGLVAPWLQNKAIVEAVYGGAEGVTGLIEVSHAAEAAGGQIIPAAGPEGAEGVLMPIGGYYYEADRGAIPEYDDKWNNAGWEGWLTYHPADNPQRLDKPLAIVHSESAAIPQGVQTFLAGFAGEATAQWLEDVTQFDFYDNPEDVTRAADTVADHFRAGSSN